MRRQRVLLTVCALCLLGPTMTSAADVATQRPNILFIIADDCTYRDVGCYGGQAHTPHIDRLAQQGMRFTQSFQAAPMCSPTRHCIYTGLYPVKSGAYPQRTFAKAGTQSIVHYLQPLGYRVGLNGKSHVAPKSVFPFEYSKAGRKGKQIDWDAVDGLFSESAENQSPFCLFVCSTEPHQPWNKGDATRYDPAALELPPYFVDTPVTRDHFARYLAEITFFDEQVGRCLDLLDRHKLSESTLVIVTTEQGSSFPFGKWTCYDTGLQNGLIARWPGKIEPGNTSDALIEYVDLVPTFLETAGGAVPDGLDGRSYLPVLFGKQSEHKQYVFGLQTTRGITNGSDHYGIRMVRSKQFKYIRNLTPEAAFKNNAVLAPIFESWRQKAANDPHAAERVHRYQHRPGEELYDVEQDPYEWNNLAEDPKFVDVLKQMRTQLDAWMAEQGDNGQQTELDARKHQVSPLLRRR